MIVFHRALSDYLDSLMHHDRHHAITLLAADLEVARSTVERWAAGTARPHPAIARAVLAWIARRA